MENDVKTPGRSEFEPHGWRVRGERSYDYIPISLGVSLGSCEGEDVFQPSADRYCHCAIVGKSGSGKSNLIGLMQREDILSGAGLAIFATHVEDALYPLSCVPPERMDDVVVIDATDEEYLPCLNPLDVEHGDDAAAQHAAESTLELVMSGSETSWTGPRFEELMRNSLGLILSTPAESGENFIGQVQGVMTDPEDVKSRLKYVTDKSIYDFWTKEYPAMQRSLDAGEVTSWALSKVSAFMNNRTLAAMFGPGKKTVDFRDIVDNGKILVVLAPAASIGDEPARIIKTWVLMELFTAIMERGGVPGRQGLIRGGRSPEPLDPFYVYCDEFSEMAMPGFARMLSQFRKRNVGMVLGFQNLEQLVVHDPKHGKRSSAVLDSVLANTGTIIAYRMGVRDSSILAGRFNVDERKLQDIKRYKPKAMVRLEGEELSFDLEIPLKPEADDPSMPGRIMDSLIERGVLLRVRPALKGYELVRGDAEEGGGDVEGDCGGGCGDGQDDGLDELYLFDDLGIAERWANKFCEGGVFTVADLVGKSEEGLRNIDGIGEAAIRELKIGLDKLGLNYLVKWAQDEGEGGPADELDGEEKMPMLDGIGEDLQDLVDLLALDFEGGESA